MRCTGEIDITRPRWKEQPTQVTSLIINIMKTTQSGQHRKDFSLAREEGLKASETLLERVGETPFGWIKTRIMRRLITVYRATIGVREHPKFFLINIFGIIKDSLLEEAKQLVEQ